MNIFINILVGIICLIIGYLFGSIPFAVIYGKIKYHADVRDFGSHNAGATNVRRTWGKKAGTLVTILDGLKTFLPFLLCWLILTYVPFGERPLIATTEVYYLNPALADQFIIKFPIYWLSVIGVTIGHCWPCFASFKGGKGAASMMGICGYSSWMLGLVPVGILYFALRKKTKIVSLSVLIANFVGIIISWIFTILFYFKVIPTELYFLPGYGPMFNIPLYYSVTVTLIYLIVVFRHKENIINLINGTERITQ